MAAKISENLAQSAGNGADNVLVPSNQTEEDGRKGTAMQKKREERMVRSRKG